MQKRSALFMAVSATLVPVAVQASLIAGDSYVIGSGAYTAGTSLASQYATVPIAGFATSGGGTGTAQFQTQTSGLVNSTAQADATSSGKIGYINPGVTNLARSTAHNLNTVPNSSTYYESFLVNEGTWTGSGANSSSRSIVVGFGNATTPTAAGTTASATGIYVGFAQDGTAASNAAGGSLVLRYNSNSANTIADQILLDGTASSIQNTTYLVVAEINVPSSGLDTVNWWVNPTDATSDSTLSSTALASGTFSGNILNGATPGSSYARLNYISQGWGAASGAGAYFDEARLSTDLAGLNLVAVPEPTSLALLGMGVASLLGRRRKPRA